MVTVTLKRLKHPLADFESPQILSRVDKTKLKLKICPPFTDYNKKTNNTQVDNAKGSKCCDADTSSNQTR